VNWASEKRKGLANINESLNGTHYLTDLAHVVSLVLPRSLRALQLRLLAMIRGYHAYKEILTPSTRNN